jgi:dihydroorotate dehydrogenase electron transfer subunit
MDAIDLKNVEVLWNRKADSGYGRIGIRCAGYAGARPGQFVMLRFPGRLDPLLRRPFSIFRLIEQDRRIAGIELLYKIVGRGTRLLSMVRAGDAVDLLGPLGNGFCVAPDTRRIFMVGGGIGAAPLVFLAGSFKKGSVSAAHAQVFIGGKTRGDLPAMDAFSAMGLAVNAATEDGSFGFQGLVTGLLERAIEENPPDLICACGPMGMLQVVARLAKKYKIPCQVSIETLMACGMGACLGCAVARSDADDSYFHVCTDGPVFDALSLRL